jgi:hypothetical protein
MTLKRTTKTPQTNTEMVIPVVIRCGGLGRGCVCKVNGLGCQFCQGYVCVSQSFSEVRQSYTASFNKRDTTEKLRNTRGQITWISILSASASFSTLLMFVPKVSGWGVIKSRSVSDEKVHSFRSLPLGAL